MAQDSHSQNNVLVDIKGLKTHFEVGSKGIIFGLGASRNIVRAVDGVDLTIREGETLGLVGESGCGKSTLGYSILQLEKPTGGTVSFEGTDLTKLKKSENTPVPQEDADRLPGPGRRARPSADRRRGNRRTDQDSQDR